MSARILCTITSYFLTPLFSIFCILLYIYRRIVEITLKIQYGEKFIGLLEGADVVWTIEEPTALSVINILVILEDKTQCAKSNFLEKFRILIKDRLVNSPFSKLLYQRHKKYGYYFWVKGEDINLEERVRLLPHEHSICNGACNDVYSESFKTTIQNISNQPLPHNHSTSWEILVGSKCVRSNSQYLRFVEEGKSLFGKRTMRNGNQIPILFRVHHSLGDGMALIKLLLETISDKEVLEQPQLSMNGEMFKLNKNYDDFGSVLVSSPPNNHTIIDFNMYDERILMHPVEDVLGPFMPYTYLISIQFANQFLANYLNAKIKLLLCISFYEILNWMKVYMIKQYKRLKNFVTKNRLQKIKDIIRIITIVTSIPMFLIEQTLRSLDNSALHGPMLTGEKLVACWLESDFREPTEQTLLVKIREIKSFTGARFEDILLAALSSSLHKYLIRIDEIPPKFVTVVLPSQTNPSTQMFALGNHLSVGLLPLCISEANGKMLSYPIQNSEVFERLTDISKAHVVLKNNPDYLINSWVINYLCALLPEGMIRPLLESHSTMVFSNLPGPLKIQILGYNLKHINFWVPNRSTTGIGFSVFSYGNDLELSLIADKAVMRNNELLAEILENTVREINNLYDIVSQSWFSRKFIAGRPVSMEIE